MPPLLRVKGVSTHVSAPALVSPRVLLLLLLTSPMCSQPRSPRAFKNNAEAERLSKILGEERFLEVSANADVLPHDEFEAHSSNSPDEDDYERHVSGALSKLNTFAEQRLRNLLQDTHTDACRELVAHRFVEVFGRVIREDWLPFETTTFRSECNASSRSSSSSSNETQQGAPPLSADSIRLCYLILCHEEQEQVIRMINALREESWRHAFVIHVDAKANATHRALTEWARNESRVFVMDAGRANVSWGGFGVVRGTLNALSSALNHFSGEFDWIVTLSGYTYPLVSNQKIRDALSTFPRDSQFMEIRPQPNDPSPRAWHQYVECDNKMRRIYRLSPPQGIKMYMGSQWMLITRDFAQYVVGDDSVAQHRIEATSNPTSGLHPNVSSDAKLEAASSLPFAQAYERYAAYTMVADENFFVTVLKNSPFCTKHVNDNFLHVQFDRWENEKATAAAHKCLQPNPRHCGRSPTTLTLDYLPVLDLGGALFARKFDARKDAVILGALDQQRRRELEPGYVEPEHPMFTNVRIVWRPHHYEATPHTELCVALQTSSTTQFQPLRAGPIKLEACNATKPSQLFTVGPCSIDGNITISHNGPATVVPGAYAPAPFCPIHFGTTTSSRRLCLDLEREHIHPGTSIIAYPCSGRWNQLFGFGALHQPPSKPTLGHVFISVPYAFHVPKELCLEVNYPGLHVMACQHDKVEQLFHVEYAA